MTPERARKLAQACADSWYGGASGLSLKEAITQGIMEACQETEGDLVATRAERDTYRQDLAAALALRDKLLPGYCTSTGISDDSGHAITIHYATREDMERAHEALCDAADAALAGEKK